VIPPLPSTHEALGSIPGAAKQKAFNDCLCGLRTTAGAVTLPCEREGIVGRAKVGSVPVWDVHTESWQGDTDKSRFILGIRDTPVIPALGRLKQEVLQFEASSAM
jgi:hypothetical protein